MFQLFGECRGWGIGTRGVPGVFVVPVYSQLQAGSGLQPAFCSPGVSAYLKFLGSLFGEGVYPFIPGDATARWGP